MSDENHELLPLVKRQYAEGKLNRREFIRTAALLGVGVATAYNLSGSELGVQTALAEDAPRGGTLRIGIRCHDLSHPHSNAWLQAGNVISQVCDHLTVIGHDNIVRPSLVDTWSPSADLKTWTLNLRRDVKWHNGRQFTADDVVWNLKHVLDPATASAVFGLMKSYLIEEIETGEKDDKGNPKKTARLWKEDAIEKVDDFTVRLTGLTPQLAVPEWLSFYSLAILDPEEGGEFGVGSNGTGPFELITNEVGSKQVIRALKGTWGGDPLLDEVEFIDLGDEAAAWINALASRQVHGLFEGDIGQINVAKNLPGVKVYHVPSALTACARMHPVAPFDDKRVRQAMRHAVDVHQVMEVAVGELGLPGEHHHVCPIHPEYAKLPELKKDVERAKALLAEAGHPNGIDVEIVAKPEPAWELVAVQALVDQWKDAGIRVKINVLPSSQYWEVWNKVPFGYTDWGHRPLGTMMLGLAYRTGVPWNDANYSNPEFDRLLTQAEGTVDVDARREIMAKLEAILQEDTPMVQPFWISSFTFYHEDVLGFAMHPQKDLRCNTLSLRQS